MSTFLELVQDTARQSGTLAGGVTLSSVVGVSGRADKLVYWVRSAWEDIQNQRDWTFLTGDFEGSLTAGTHCYTPASFNLTRFKNWSRDTAFWQPTTIYDPAIGQSDENTLRYIPHDVWRSLYGRGTHDANRPIHYSISPSREICFGPVPDKTYTVRGEYQKAPQQLVANTDEPEAPSHLHKIIVYRAMVLMGESDESPLTITAAQNEYRRMFVNLCEECLPHVDMERGAALA